MTPFNKFGLNHGLASVVALFMLALNASGQGNYDNIFSVSPEQMFEGIDAATVSHFSDANRAAQENPNDVTALVTRAVIALDIADRSRYSFHWVHFAAKDLEKALRIDPNNFYARHNYAMACYQAGDFNDSQPNMRLAVIQFTKAIQIKPDSARTYMGRGWAYLMLDDPTHAEADFQRTLQLDPRLKNEMVRQANAIVQKRGQKAAVLAMMQRLGSYIVNRGPRTAEQCAAVKGYWTNSECRISTAMAPGPLYPGGPNPPSARSGVPSSSFGK